MSRDRLEELIASTTLNGIDYVEIGSLSQKVLIVRFLNEVALAAPLPGVNQVSIRGGARVTDIEIHSVLWGTDLHGRPMATLQVEPAGDFSSYTLRILNANLDPYFDHVTFSFKALCESTLDCEPRPHVCPPPAGELPAIDYLSKDFLSFRKALSDFSALRYPDWVERSEADFGMMFMEALCKIADDLSYYQDRIGFEASLETATQRRSLVRHARMVDYEPRPAVSASVLLQFDVPAGTTTLPAGITVSAAGPDGTRIPFETGTGLGDTSTYAVNPSWNRGTTGGMRGYYWDDAQRCLLSGSTEAWLHGHGLALKSGTALLVDTQAVVSADAPIREVVHLVTDGVELVDPIFGEAVTHITWSDPLRFDHDITLDTAGHSRTAFVGNLVPATQGRRATEFFAIDAAPPSAGPMPLAIVREGAVGSESHARYLWTLREAPLAYLAAASAEDAPLPEIELLQQSTPAERWGWKRRLLDAQPSERSFTIEPFRMLRVSDALDPAPSYEYDGDGGTTIRFGGGDFGETPAAETTFRVAYRVGGGARGNVAADAITRVDTPAFAALAVTNPFPAAGGADEETAERVRRLAPQAFRAKQYRAVRPDDYSRAAETLPWVSRGGTVVRWTGSWLTIFTTADPKGSGTTTTDQRIKLAQLLDRYRMAGRDVATPLADYAALDVEIVVCATPEAYRGDVEESLREVLLGKGFFAHDNFTFGTPLYRSALEAAVQSARGVSGVVTIKVRRRGHHQQPVHLPSVFRVGKHEILRVDDDPSFPENGSLNLIVRGGK
ncbi:MAG TPA: baseplate J/gp47 family protein [Thermoanaerobaculia bacterium]